MSEMLGAEANEIRLEPKNREEFRPGGFWWRLLAYIMDNCIVGIINLPLTILVVLAGGLADPTQGETAEANALMIALTGLQWLLQLAVTFYYYGWFYKYKGATPGKMVIGLRVVDSDTGTNIGYARAFFRETLGKFISVVTLFIGFMMAGWTKEKTALHDLIFSTRVLKRN